MSDFYTEDQRALQAKFGREKLAVSAVEAIVRDEIDGETAAFIASRDFFFLASVDASGCPTVSYKGGAPGFVRVIDSRTLAFPSYDGNGMYLSAGNIASTGKIGLLFIDFEKPNRIRVQADAAVTADPERCGLWPGAELVIEARVTSVFLNCPRYVHPHKRLGLSRFVPDATTGEAPLADWKRIDMIQDVLTEDERSRVEALGGPISEEEYNAKLRAGEL